MIKITTYWPEAESHVDDEDELLVQMTEACATTKALKQSCDDLRALLDQAPGPETLALLERTETRYREATEHLIQIYGALLKSEPSFDVMPAL